MRRMLLILNNIKKRQRISKQELLSRVNDSLYYIYGYKEIGVRTLERDLEDIESMFCVKFHTTEATISYSDFGESKRIKRDHNHDIEVIRRKLNGIF